MSVHRHRSRWKSRKGNSTGRGGKPYNWIRQAHTCHLQWVSYRQKKTIKDEFFWAILRAWSLT